MYDDDEFVSEGRVVEAPEPSEVSKSSLRLTVVQQNLDNQDMYDENISYGKTSHNLSYYIYE